MIGWNVSEYLEKISVTDIFPLLEESRHEADEKLLQGKKKVFEFFFILYHSRKFLFEAITTFWLPLLLNVFKYILKVNYLAAWHFCFGLCCSLYDLKLERKHYSLKKHVLKLFFPSTCAHEGLPTLTTYKAIKWREQLVEVLEKNWHLY